MKNQLLLLFTLAAAALGLSAKTYEDKTPECFKFSQQETGSWNFVQDQTSLAWNASTSYNLKSQLTDGAGAIFSSNNSNIYTATIEDDNNTNVLKVTMNNGWGPLFFCDYNLTASNVRMTIVFALTGAAKELDIYLGYVEGETNTPVNTRLYTGTGATTYLWPENEDTPQWYSLSFEGENYKGLWLSNCQLGNNKYTLWIREVKFEEVTLADGESLSTSVTGEWVTEKEVHEGTPGSKFEFSQYVSSDDVEESTDWSWSYFMSIATPHAEVVKAETAYSIPYLLTNDTYGDYTDGFAYLYNNPNVTDVTKYETTVKQHDGGFPYLELGNVGTGFGGAAFAPTSSVWMGTVRATMIFRMMTEETDSSTDSDLSFTLYDTNCTSFTSFSSTLKSSDLVDLGKAEKWMKLTIEGDGQQVLVINWAQSLQTNKVQIAYINFEQIDTDDDYELDKGTLVEGTAVDFGLETLTVSLPEKKSDTANETYALNSKNSDTSVSFYDTATERTYVTDSSVSIKQGDKFTIGKFNKIVGWTAEKVNGADSDDTTVAAVMLTEEASDTSLPLAAVLDLGVSDDEDSAIESPVTFTDGTMALVVSYEGSQAKLAFYASSATTGLDAIVSDMTVNGDNAPTVYYNLQGVRVANPERGTYIRVQGNKATKVIF